MAGNHEVETSRFARQVEEIEKLIRAGGSASGGQSLAALLQTTQARLEEARNEERHAGLLTKDKKERDQNVAIAHMVEREHKLNQMEREEYGRFLEMDYFTRADVKKLDEFYAGAWDRLTDDGKAEMSQRLWEGIRRGELEFTDLAEESRKKEAQFLYQSLQGQIQADHPLGNMLERDKADFIRAYEAKDEKAVTEVLSRDSVSQHVGKSASTEADSSRKTDSGEKKADDGLEKPAAGGFGELATTFGEDQPAVKPTDLRNSSGGLSRS